MIMPGSAQSVACRVSFWGGGMGAKRVVTVFNPMVIFALYGFLTVICGRPHQGEYEPYCTNRMAHGNLSSS